MNCYTDVERSVQRSSDMWSERMEFGKLVTQGTSCRRGKKCLLYVTEEEPIGLSDGLAGRIFK